MLRLVSCRRLRWMPLSALLWSVQALAQFEVAPDHFDSTEKDAVMHRAAAKDKTKATPRPTSNTGTPTSSVGWVATVHHKGNVERTSRRAARRPQLKPSAEPGWGGDRVAVARRKRAAGNKIGAVSP
jgi:hypothetical protein